MKVSSAIKRRRSIRRYKAAVPGHKVTNKVLEAARWAPSGLNNQPWKLQVITDKEKKSGLARFTEYSSMVRSAPAVICVFLDKNSSYDREKDIMAIGACIQNMLLEAHELGLGTCWLGEILRMKKAAQAYLGVPRSLELMAVIALGYSAKTPYPTRRKALKTLILRQL